jgi:hypothetical protein
MQWLKRPHTRTCRSRCREPFTVGVSPGRKPEAHGGRESRHQPDRRPTRHARFHRTHKWSWSPSTGKPPGYRPRRRPTRHRGSRTPCMTQIWSLCWTGDNEATAQRIHDAAENRHRFIAEVPPQDNRLNRATSRRQEGRHGR